MEMWCPDDTGRDSWDWATYLGDSTIQLPRVVWRLLVQATARMHTNCGDHVPVDMTPLALHAGAGPQKLTLNLANDENRPLESSPPARELGRETHWAT